MDILGIPIWLYLLALALALIVYYMWYMSMDLNIFEKMKLDGPGPMPILGNLGYVISPGLYYSQLDLYTAYKEKKVFGFFDSRTPCLMVTDLDIIGDILIKHFDKFPNRQRYIHGDSILHHSLPFLQDQQWKQVKNIVTSALGRPENLRAIPDCLEPVNTAMYEYLKEQIEEDEEVDLNELSSNFAVDSLLASCFGIETNTFQDFDYDYKNSIRKIQITLWLTKMVHFFFPFFHGLCRFIGFCSCEKSVKFFTKLTDSAISKDKEYSPLMKLIAQEAELFYEKEVTAEPGFPKTQEMKAGNTQTDVPSRDIIKGQGFSLLLGGYNTITTVMAYTLFMLANNPDCCLKVQDEIDKLLEMEWRLTYDTIQRLTFLDMCIDEVLRMFPSGVNVERVCVEEVTIRGFRFPKGMPVFIPVHAIHHDPELWQEPEEFVPERFHHEVASKQCIPPYLPFGQGPRKCLGAELARVHIKLGIATILRTMTPSQCYQTVYPVKLSRFSNSASDGLWVKMDIRE